MKERLPIKIHLIGVAFFFVFDFIFYYPRIVSDLHLSILLFLFMCLVYALHIWFFTFLIVYLVHRLFPALQHKTGKRIILFLLLLPVTLLLTSAFQSFFFNLLNHGMDSSLFYLHYEDVGMNLLYSLIIIFFLELFYYFHHYTKAVEEAAELKKSNVLTQFNSLKNQVNPHFLFNSLNSLSSLIQINPELAVTFVHKLSNVYRYLLQTNERDVTELREELKFLQAYLHLLQTRFGQAIAFNLLIEPAAEDYLLPPLTLQLLVENAVKHNIVSASMPLQITIYTKGEQLIVTNTLQKKKTPATSHGIGLVNIISKYRLLTSAPIEITETEAAFTVILPLLKTTVYERTDH